MKIRKIISLLLILCLLCYPIGGSITVSAETSGYYEYSINTDDETTCTITKYTGMETNVNIPSELEGLRVTSIGDYAFAYCMSLRSITIPNSVTSIGDYAFAYCMSLRSITIPNSVTSIGDYAFTNCMSLSSITIPNSVTSIGDYAFTNCMSLSSITIPNSVTSIGIYAFENCFALSSITIPNSVTSIGNYAFAECHDLQSVYFDGNIPSIGLYAFISCHAELKFYYPESISGAPAYYISRSALDINVDSLLQHGSIIPSTSKGIPGQTISLNITPDAGYTLKAGTLNFNSTSIANYSFTMPDESVSITAEFEKIPVPVVTVQTLANQPPTWSWTDATSGGYYRYRLNSSGTWKNTVSQSYTPTETLPNGEYTLEVQQIDSLGFWSDSGSATVTLPITTPTPIRPSAPTPTITPAPTPSIELTSEGNLLVSMNITDTDTEDESAMLPVSIENFTKNLSDSRVKQAILSVQIPDSLRIPSGNKGVRKLILKSELLEAAKKEGKELTVIVKDEKGKERYRWNFDTESLEKMKTEGKDINLPIQVTDLSETSQQINLMESNKRNGFVLQLAEEENLPLVSHLRVYVGDWEGGNVSRKVYVYHYNTNTRKLETLPYSSNYSVDEEGYLNLSVIKGSDYVVLYQKAPTNVITGMVHQVKVISANNTLALGDKKTSSQQLSITLPPTLTLVSKIEKKPISQNRGMGTVTVSYSSSNQRVAKVDKTGKITAIGKGTTVISATITLYTGKKRVVQIPIIVKE